MLSTSTFVLACADFEPHAHQDRYRETQLMRKLSNTPLQIQVDLLRTKSHEATHVSAGHLETFYRTFEDIENEHYDGLIITGALVELMEFEEVDYWEELCRIMDWSSTHVHSTLHICWGAQAGLYYHYGIQKYRLPKKASAFLLSSCWSASCRAEGF